MKSARDVEGTRLFKAVGDHMWMLFAVLHVDENGDEKPIFMGSDPQNAKDMVEIVKQQLIEHGMSGKVRVTRFDRAHDLEETKI
jgi:hypothetical protein